ncbi:MAG: MFS transporter, partial [Rubrobacteraceae bacterium]|nr:MFS transporter [Rubrobacteraceae bacterium]
MEQSVERVGGEKRSERTPMGRVIASSVVGNVIEQFDFAIYGSMAALVFGPL